MCLTISAGGCPPVSSQICDVYKLPCIYKRLMIIVCTSLGVCLGIVGTGVLKSPISYVYFTSVNILIHFRSLEDAENYFSSLNCTNIYCR